MWLNGKSFGRKTIAKNSHARWTVPYAPGVLEARGYKDGKVALTGRRETTGEPSKLSLNPDRSKLAADGEDVSTVALEVRDAQGRIVPTASDLVRFSLVGPGKIIGVGNGDPSSREADKPDAIASATRKAFNGLCMVFLQSTKSPGAIRIEASAEGLEAVSVVIRSEAATPRPAAI